MVLPNIVSRGYQIATKFYKYSKPTITGDSFVSRFPPNYRNTVRTVLKGSEIAFTGGLVADFLKDLNNPGLQDNGAPFQPAPSGKFRQKSGRHKRRSGYGRKFSKYNSNRYGRRRSINKCDCVPNRRYRS